MFMHVLGIKTEKTETWNPIWFCFFVCLVFGFLNVKHLFVYWRWDLFIGGGW